MNVSRLVHAALDTTVPQPALVTVPNVQLLEVGEEWATSTGSFTFTSEDLVSCIQSQQDPSLRTPVVKLGHVDPRFDGQPSLGKIENMRLDNNNQTLVGDLVAMPLWLAQVMYTAYPRRSIEGQMSFTTRTGNTWPMVLTGVALLGDMYPAIDTLEDIQALWGATPPPLYLVQDVEEISASGSFFRARKAEDMTRLKVNASSPVKAAVGLDAVRSAFYGSLDGPQSWWWIREVRVNPLTLIVDDDEGSLWEIPVTVSAADEITFDAPKSVKVEYVAATGAPWAEALPGQVVAAAHATPEETGRTSRPDPEDTATLVPSSNAPMEENDLMLTEEELAALGLQPDATREQISAAIMGKPESEPSTDGNPLSQPETPSSDPAAQPATAPVPAPESVTPATIPAGMVLVDAAMLEEMRSGVAAAAGLVKRQETEDREKVLNDAIRAGKFPLGRKAHYGTLLSADPIGAKALIATLEPGLIPVSESGEQGNDVAIAASNMAYPAGWAQTVEAGRRSLGDRVKVIQD